jgi:hypothetical protein
MENVVFRPWEGVNYAEGFNGKKILLLGDSQYNTGDEDGDFVHNLVENFIGYKERNCPHAGYMNTYTKFTNILFGEKVDSKTTINFWQSIAFYNYVQKSQEGHSISPTNEEFDDSQSAFVEVLEDYQPDLVIVWGWRLWGRITKFGTETDFDTSEKMYYLEAKNKKILACGIPHPRVLSYDWTDYLQEAIKLA